MISVVICRPNGQGDWEIDTWVMSCRVLGRKVEHMVLGEMLRHARRAGIRRLIGTYKPTERNMLVIDHYKKLGFKKVAEDATGIVRWEMDVEGANLQEASMKVVSTGFREKKQSAA